jgi:hypothetical protein
MSQVRFNTKCKSKFLRKVLLRKVAERGNIPLTVAKLVHGPFPVLPELRDLFPEALHWA